LQDFNISTQAFLNREESPTGLICGARTARVLSDARYLEEKYDDQELYSLKGDRRYAWVWPESLKFDYNERREELKMEFYLPKGSYATTFLEEIAKRELK
jgi:tRNA pseudouridine13 synthase